MREIEYKTEFQHIPLEKRRAESRRIREKYPGRCCIIVSKALNTDAPSVDRHKYLVPGDITMGQFTFVIRRRIKINSEKAIFMFIEGSLPATSALMSAIYDEKKNEDGFLYITYAAENTFG